MPMEPASGDGVAAKDVPAAAPAVPAGAVEEAGGWPDDRAEAAFIAEERGRGEPANAASAANAMAVARAPEETEPQALPTVDELVQRIPPGTVELLDELFRAKFVAVRRVRKSDLKTIQPDADPAG